MMDLGRLALSHFPEAGGEKSTWLQEVPAKGTTSTANTDRNTKG